MRRTLLTILPVALAAAALGGCGSSGGSGASPGSTGSTPPTDPSSGSTDAGALQGEAKSAATGDIPDNQVFLTFPNPSAGWSMKYPEGWAQKGAGDRVTFQDKNNIVRVVIFKAETPTAASVSDALASNGADVVSGPTTVDVNGSKALKVVYTTQSPPNPVTGKRVTLQVDRYYLSHGGKVAILDLGTPKGVDNVDAYRLMSESFRWR